MGSNLALWWNVYTTVLEAVARKEYASASLVMATEFNLIARRFLYGSVEKG